MKKFAIFQVPAIDFDESVRFYVDRMKLFTIARDLGASPRVVGLQCVEPQINLEITLTESTKQSLDNEEASVGSAIVPITFEIIVDSVEKYCHNLSPCQLDELERWELPYAKGIEVTDPAGNTVVISQHFWSDLD